MSVNWSQSSPWSCLHPGQFPWGQKITGHLKWPGAILQQVSANAVSVTEQTPDFRFRLQADGEATGLAVTMPLVEGACSSRWLEPGLLLGDEWMTWVEEVGSEDQRASDLVLLCLVSPPASNQIIVPVQQVARLAAGDWLAGNGHHTQALQLTRVTVRCKGPAASGTQLQIGSAARPTNPLAYEVPAPFTTLHTFSLPVATGAWLEHEATLQNVTVPAGHIVRVRCSAVPTVPANAPEQVSVVLYGTLQE